MHGFVASVEAGPAPALHGGAGPDQVLVWVGAELVSSERAPRDLDSLFPAGAAQGLVRRSGREGVVQRHAEFAGPIVDDCHPVFHRQVALRYIPVCGDVDPCSLIRFSLLWLEIFLGFFLGSFFFFLGSSP